MQGDLEDAVFALHPHVVVFVSIAAEHSLTPFVAVSVTGGESGYEGPRPRRKTCMIVPPRARARGARSTRRPSGPLDERIHQSETSASDRYRLHTLLGLS